MPLMDGPVARAFTCSPSLLSPNKSYILHDVAREERSHVIVRHLSWQAKMLTFIQGNRSWRGKWENHWFKERNQVDVVETSEVFVE